MAFQDASLPGKGLKVPAIFSNYQRKEEPLIPKSDKLKNGLKSKTNKLLDACVIESFAHHPVPYFSFKLNSEEMPPPTGHQRENRCRLKPTGCTCKHAETTHVADSDIHCFLGLFNSISCCQPLHFHNRPKVRQVLCAAIGVASMKPNYMGIEPWHYMFLANERNRLKLSHA